MIYIVTDPHQPLLGLLTPTDEVRVDMDRPDEGHAAIVVPPKIAQPEVEKLRRRYPTAEVWSCDGYLKLKPGDYVYYAETAESFLVEAT